MQTHHPCEAYTPATYTAANGLVITAGSEVYTYNVRGTVQLERGHICEVSVTARRRPGWSDYQTQYVHYQRADRRPLTDRQRSAVWAAIRAAEDELTEERRAELDLDRKFYALFTARKAIAEVRAELDKVSTAITEGNADELAALAYWTGTTLRSAMHTFEGIAHNFKEQGS